MKFLEPVYSHIEIVLYQYNDGQPSVVDVSGINPNPEPDDITSGLALEFTTWDKWLGMDTKPLKLKEFTESEIICHCLNEMTYVRFEEDEIQAEFSKLKSIVDEYKALTPEERAAQAISLDKSKKRLTGISQSSR